jgi:hypothetical protein
VEVQNHRAGDATSDAAARKPGVSCSITLPNRPEQILPAVCSPATGAVFPI